MSQAVATAIITAVPGREEEFKEALRVLAVPTNEEPGCVEFRFFEDLEVPGRVILWEIFATQEALQTHMEADHTKAFFASGLLGEGTTIRTRAL